MTKELKAQLKSTVRTYTGYFLQGTLVMIFFIIFEAIILFPFLAKSHDHYDLFSLSNYIS